MSCYFRHLGDVFKEPGIEITPSNRKIIDAKIHEIVGVQYKNCPKAWAEVKKWLANDDNRLKLIEALKNV
jgi:hypothetical protein